MIPLRVLVAIVASVTALVVVSADTAPPQRSLRDLLVRQLSFTDAQVAAVRRGEAVAVNQPSPVVREIGVAGAVRIDAPASRLVQVVGDIERLESGKGFIGTKKMSEPPTLADMATFELPDEDLAALRTCRPGRCPVKLGQAAFDRLAKVNWNSADAAGQASQLMRQLAVEYVESYRKGGNAALAVYRDAERPTFIAHEFAAMVKESSGLTSALPDVARYLLQYPQARPASVEDFFYWSLAEFGLKPVFRLNHVVIHPTGQSSGLLYAITTKQLYASHYFHTALEVRALIDDAEKPGKGHYLVVLNLARSDGLTGLFGGIVRSKARNGARSGLEAALTGMKTLAESEP